MLSESPSPPLFCGIPPEPALGGAGVGEVVLEVVEAGADEVVLLDAGGESVPLAAPLGCEEPPPHPARAISPLAQNARSEDLKTFFVLRICRSFMNGGPSVTSAVGVKDSDEGRYLPGEAHRDTGRVAFPAKRTPAADGIGGSRGRIRNALRRYCHAHATEWNQRESQPPHRPPVRADGFGVRVCNCRSRPGGLRGELDDLGTKWSQ